MCHVCVCLHLPLCWFVGGLGLSPTPLFGGVGCRLCHRWSGGVVSHRLRCRPLWGVLRVVRQNRWRFCLGHRCPDCGGPSLCPFVCGWGVTSHCPRRFLQRLPSVNQGSYLCALPRGWHFLVLSAPYGLPSVRTFHTSTDSVYAVRFVLRDGKVGISPAS